MDQKTGKGDVLEGEGKERERNKRIEGRRGRNRLRERRRAAEKAKADRKSTRKERVGWERRK